MFTRLKGYLALKAPVYKLKNYLRDFTSDKRKTFVEQIIEKELRHFYNKRIGSYVGLEFFEIKYIKNKPVDINNLEIMVKVSLFFYKVEQKEIIQFKVLKITPRFIEGIIYNIRVDLSLDQLSASPVVYNSVTNTVTANEKRIKEGDIIRGRITGFFKSISAYVTSYAKVKVTCRNTGSGKVQL
jgi:hypothetical protein